VRVQVSSSRFDSASANLQGEYEFDRYSVRPVVLTLPTLCGQERNIESGVLMVARR
jgi:hypothetical protein